MGTTSNTLFSGNSRYASDFQSIISRAVSIASLPLTQLQSGLSTLTAQSTELSTVSAKLISLQSAFSGISTAATSNSVTASSSNSDVSVSVSDQALPASYTVEVTNLGSYNTAMAKDGLVKVTDPSTGSPSTATNFTLSAGGSSYSFSASNLNDMVTEINKSGLSVQASVVNVGSSDSPDYRLSVQGTKLGALSVSLKDDASTPNELLSTLNAGAKAAYKVNGYATEATSDTRTVSIAPGVTINLAAKSTAGSPATITVKESTDSVKNSISSFVTAYNSVVSELDKNRGENGGALTGQNIVYTISQQLSSILGYSSGSGAITSLADIGVSISQDGQMSFDSSVFDKAASNNADDVMSFLGSSTKSGFLKSAADSMSMLEDSTNGAVTSAVSLLSSQISNQSDRITAQQQRISDLQTSLNQRMAAADAAVAQLEQQAVYITNLFASMKSDASSYN